MRAVTGPIWDLWNAGGPFIGPSGKPHGRVTVEEGWVLRSSVGTGIGYLSDDQLPIRWFQRADESQVETEVPNVVSIHRTQSIDTDAATCEIQLRNQKMAPANTDPTELGNVGYYTWSRGSSAAAFTRWGHVANAWANVLVPNALLRTYEGYGGYNDDGTKKSIADCLSEGSLLQTGVWLVDEVRITTDGMIDLRCRDMEKLLMEQLLYPPLVPAGLYADVGLHFQRFYVNEVPEPGTPYGHLTSPLKKIVGMEPDLHDDGYWLVGDDGGTFTYGNNAFYGSRGGVSAQKVVGIARLPSGRGYWDADVTGVVVAYGAAAFHGDLTGAGVSNVVAIEAASDGGYWMCGTDGGVFTFGDAQFYGSLAGVTLAAPIVGMAVTPDRLGYWLVGADGGVFAFGSAVNYGNLVGTTLAAPITGMCSTPTGNGYYLCGGDGGVFAFGDAVFHGDLSAVTLNDPVSDIVAFSDSTGYMSYWMVAEDGGVFAFGLAQFYGSLPGDFSETFVTDGNYTDYADIVKLLLLWAGFWLYDGGIDSNVYGNIETTNAYATDELPDTIFDKVPVIDALTKIKEVVGYLLWCDEEGAIHFEPPNWWSPGNFLPDGSRVTTFANIDETVNLTNYGMSHNDDAARTEIIIASEQPTLDIPGTVTTVVPSPTASVLRGIVKPTMFVNELFTSEDDQRAMAELIAIQLWFQQRLGSVQCAALPLLQINDQVVVWERQTDESYIHYVRSIESSHDLETGEWTMTLTTHWLGDETSWAITQPPHPVPGTHLDTGVGTETYSVFKSFTGAESGVGTDRLISLNRVLAPDTGSGSETASAQPGVNSSDSGVGADSLIALDRVLVPDSGVGAEGTTTIDDGSGLFLFTGDLGIGTDAATLAAVFDSFDRANSATALGNADSGQAWTARQGTWGISGNQPYNPNAFTGGQEGGQADLDSLLSDGIVAVTITAQPPNSKQAGLIFRLQDANNYFAAYVVSTSGGVAQLWLDKVIGNAWSNPGGNITVTGITFPCRLSVRLLGSAIQVTLSDGVRVFRRTLTSTSFQTATRHGLNSYGTATPLLDDFLVVPFS